MRKNLFRLKFHGTLILITAVLMSGCHMQKLVVDVYVPPRIELPPDVRAILVGSRFVPATGDYEAVQWGYFESVDSALWDLSKYYTESFSTILDSTGRFISKAEFDLKMLRNNNDSLPGQLPWNGLSQIASDHRASGLAILQGFSVNEGDIEMSEEENNGQLLYNAGKEISVTAAWRFYQPERRRLLDENIYTFNKEFNSQGRNADEAVAGLPSSEEMLRQACYWAAEQYAGMIIPGNTDVERLYYKDGNKRMAEAHEAMQQGDWRKAEIKWRYLAYNEEDEEIKARANYNMALVCERDGRLNQALGYARKSNKLHAHNRHLDLINELTIKLFDEEELRKKGEIIRNW